MSWIRNKVIDGKKQCSRCKEFKEINLFNRSSVTRSKLFAYCKPCQSEWEKEHYIKTRYNISPKRRETILLLQNNKCRICSVILTKVSKMSNTICIDHDHKTNKFRALLCRRCNFALGLIDDNPETARKMMMYLNSFRKDQIKDYLLKETPQNDNNNA